MVFDKGIDVAHVLGGRVEVRPLQPGEEEGWDRFVQASPSGTFFHLSGWKTVIETILGHRCFYLAAHNERGISGVFPICWVRNKIFGDCLVSLPLAAYGGICAEDESSYFSLLAAGSDLANRLGVRYLEMRNRSEPFPTSLPGRPLYVTFIKDLSPGEETLFKGLSYNARHRIKKCKKAGLEWTEEVTLEDFYEIYARNVHRLGTPVFSQNLFSLLRSVFPEHCRLFGVRKEGRLIAVDFCYSFKQQLLAYYAGSLEEFYRYAPNNFMYWNLIAQCCREGFQSLDFGRSKHGTGSFDFKMGWSMELFDLPYRYQLIRSKHIPHLTSVDSKFRLPIALWKRMPFAWTKTIGPRLLRWIPSV